MDRKQQVFLKLKPKVKSFGFNKKELMGIAAQIADNLTSADDASDEDVNDEIDKQIEAIIPFLQVSQSYANRLAEDARKKNDDDEPDDNDDDDSAPNGNRPSGSKPAKNNKEKNNAAPEWAKEMMKTIETLNGEIATLKGEKVSTSRKSKLEELLKDSGSYGKRIIKSFERMKFETDEEFDEFYSDVENDLKAYNQELANAGLATLANPPAANGKNGAARKEEPFTDEEIGELANGF